MDYVTIQQMLQAGASKNIGETVECASKEVEKQNGERKEGSKRYWKVGKSRNEKEAWEAPCQQEAQKSETYRGGVSSSAAANHQQATATASRQ